MPFKPNNTVLDLVNETFAADSCQKFMRDVLGGASTNKNPVLLDGDIQRIFAAFLAQEDGSISRDRLTAHGSATGKIKANGEGNATLFLPEFAPSQNQNQDYMDAKGIVNELPHIAGKKGGWPREEYDDYALAVATFEAGYDDLFRLVGDMPANSPWTGSKNPFKAYDNYKEIPGSDERYDPRWSNYFHDILNQLCVVRRDI